MLPVALTPEYSVQFSAIFTLSFFLNVEKQEIWTKASIYKIECLRCHIY